MGNDTRIVLYAQSQDEAVDAAAAAYDRFEQLDAALSDYRPSSELMRLCDHAGGPAVHVSKDLFRVLQRSCEVARLSGGAFDPTVGPVVKLWRKARKTHVFPSATELQAARRVTGWRHVILDARKQTVRLTVAGMRLDMGGIAKGFADDEAQLVLRKHGITSALVEAGGDIVVSDPPPGRKGWDIEVANPAPGDKTKHLIVSNCAVSTSGDTEQYVEFGGVRYSHIVDPRTGLGLTDRIAVTVTARNGLTSDSLSTAVSVLGEKRGAALAKHYPGVSLYMRRLTASPAATR